MELIIFVDEKTFDKMAADGELLEYALVHGNKYGTPKNLYLIKLIKEKLLY